MSEFFSTMFNEMGARRRRLRDAFGDRGQALVEFLVLGGLAVGSLGLFVREGMVERAPWALALPFVFILGFVVIEQRRQARASASQDAAKTSAGFDWLVLLWSFGCALLGAAAFVWAWTALPQTQPVEDWQPPREAVHVDISP